MEPNEIVLYFVLDDQGAELADYPTKPEADAFCDGWHARGRKPGEVKIVKRVYALANEEAVE